MDKERLLPLSAALLGGLIIPGIIAEFLLASDDQAVRQASAFVRIFPLLVIALGIFGRQALLCRSWRPLAGALQGLLAGAISGLLVGIAMRLAMRGVALAAGRHPPPPRWHPFPEVHWEEMSSSTPRSVCCFRMRMNPSGLTVLVITCGPGADWNSKRAGHVLNSTSRRCGDSRTASVNAVFTSRMSSSCFNVRSLTRARFSNDAGVIVGYPLNPPRSESIENPFNVR
ncbi:MAG TPA: hypothetical protein VNU68_14995 [Verrucomicrobiae bacterium]|nr:hypothetical protein [Verrucomicrobiae bacterium]